MIIGGIIRVLIMPITTISTMSMITISSGDQQQQNEEQRWPLGHRQRVLLAMLMYFPNQPLRYSQVDAAQARKNGKSRASGSPRLRRKPLTLCKYEFFRLSRPAGTPDPI